MLCVRRRISAVLRSRRLRPCSRRG